VVISHFDRDHISGIATLLSAFSVSDLVIPLVPLWQRLVLAFEEERYIAKADLPFYLHPVKAITDLPGAEVERIILVPPSGGEAPQGENAPTVDLGPLDAEGRRPRDLESRGLHTKKEWENSPESTGVSGPGDLDGHPNVTVLRRGGRLCVRDIWEFVPYNDATSFKPGAKPFARKAEVLRRALLAAPSEALRSSALKSLKRHYERTYRTAPARNLISLFLYGGSMASRSEYRFEYYDCHWSEDPAVFLSCGSPLSIATSGARPGVLYTGDGYLDTPARWQALRGYLGPARATAPLVFQVMHHGAKRNWRPGLAADIRPVVAVFSSDPQNKNLGHPHPPVLGDFRSRGFIAQADCRTAVVVAGTF
jgi:hypothetical protein